MSGRAGTHARWLRMVVAMVVAAAALLVASSSALAAAPVCQDDPNETTQAGAPLDVGLDCTPSSGVTYTIVTAPGHGALDQSQLANGFVTYTASTAYTGTDTFTYKATDAGNESSAVTTVTIDVAAENECFDDNSETTPTDQALTLFLQCTSGTGGTEAYSIVSGPSHGTLGTIEQDNGQVQYTPASGYDGPDSFTFKANDGTMTSATATVTVNVGNVCKDQTTTAVENAGEPLEIFLDCEDTTGATETYTLVSGPAHGNLSGFDAAQGLVNYLPAHGFTGTDSFTFRAGDGSQTSNTATVTVHVEPPPPVCQDINTATPQDTALTIPLRCTSASGSTLTLSIPTGDGPAHGTLGAVNSANQTVAYTPAAGYVSPAGQPDTFFYTATDGAGETPEDVASVSVSVGIACFGSDVTTNQGEPIEINLRCSGPDGVPLTLGAVAQPGHGTLGTVDQSGQVLYTPVAGYHGADTFTFRASGGGHQSATATITLTVKARALSCSAAQVSTLENQPITVPAQCMNRQGTTLTLSTAPSGAPAHGSLSFDNANQTITYTPTSGFTGSDSFTYVANDGSGATPTARVDVAVGISCQTFPEETTAGQPVTVPLLCNGPNGTPLTLAIATQPAHGTLGAVNHTSDSVLYTPAAGFAGTDSFTFTATGGGQTTSPTTVSITVDAPTPRCTDLSTSTAPGTAVTIPLQCGGPSGTTLTLAISQQPAEGTLGAIDTTHRTVTYTPKSGFVGNDAFLYHASGGGTTSTDAVANITVGPTCFDNFDTVTAGEPSVLSLQCEGPRGAPLTLSIVGQPLHGTLGAVDSASGEVLYTPAAGYVGPDALTFQASSGSTTTNVATESIDVTPQQVRARPGPALSCEAQDLATPTATALTVPLTCVDPDGKTLTLLVQDGPLHGTLGAITGGSSPSVVYTPVAGYVGSDGFEYAASDGDAVSDLTPVSIQVGLTCFPASSSGTLGQVQNVVLPCRGPAALGYQIVSGPQHGSLGTVSSAGIVAYTPAAGFSGTDSFTYRATSGGATSATVTATVSVNAAAPSCQGVSISTAQATAVTVPLHCTELGATLHLTVPSQSFFGQSGDPTNGTLGTIDQTAQTVTYTPEPGFSGTDTFDYEASDGSQISAQAHVVVTVGLSCFDDSEQVSKNTPLVIQLSCLSPSGTTPTVSIAAQPAHGTLGSVDQAQQTVTYTPASGYTGPDSFAIQAAGGGQTSQTAVISLDVAQPPPSCQDVQVATRVATAVSVPLHCTEAGGATLALYAPSDSSPQDGTLGPVDSVHQTVLYTPDAGFTGTDSFFYMASDGNRLSAEAEVDVDVSNGPTCQPVDLTTAEGSALNVSLSCSGGTGTISYAVVDQPAHGTLSGLDASAGTVTYTPDSGFSGTDTFTYRGSAGGQQSTLQTVTITVQAPPPTCHDVSASTDVGQAVGIALNCTDAAGRTMTLATGASPAHGTLGTIDSTDQTVTYTPAAGFSGTDTFTYKATAGGQTSALATVSITVSAGPSCTAVTGSATAGQPGSIQLSCSGGLGALTLSVVGSPTHGTVGTIDQAQQTVAYTPAAGFSGTDTFTYKATDSKGLSSAPATATITVTPQSTTTTTTTTTTTSTTSTTPTTTTTSTTPTTTTTTTPTTTTTTTTSTSPTTTTTPTPTHKLTSLHLPGSAGVSAAGVASIRLRFTGTGTGSLTLITTVVHPHHKRTSQTIGSTVLSLSGNTAKTITVHLSAFGRSLLRTHHGKLTVTITLTFRAGAHAPVSGRLTLHSATKKKKKKRK